MSQFDFPRLHFAGSFSVDPATGNNNTLHPLIFFNPLNGKVLFPPRIYLTRDYIPPGKTLDDVISSLPSGTPLLIDNETSLSGQSYVHIQALDTPEKFIEWARRPMGTWDVDQDYHPLYAAVFSPYLKGPLTGAIPGYWNYFGSNNYHLHEVSINNITIEIEGFPRTFNGSEPDCPEDLKLFLGSRLTYNFDPHDDSTNSAKMVDTLPVMNVYSQIFSDSLTLFKENHILFRGRPEKASLRQVNVTRVINENMPYSGAGNFYTSIPIQSLQKKNASPLIRLFKSVGTGDKKLKGIFIQQTVSEIEERRPMDFITLGNVSNPAFGTVTGVIAPWYEHEMNSWSISRQLNGDQPFITSKPPGFEIPVNFFTPAIFQMDPKNGKLWVDLAVNIPVVNLRSQPGPVVANPYLKNSYEVFKLGKLDFVFEKSGSAPNENVLLDLGSLTIDPDAFPRKKILEQGAIIPFSFIPSEENLQIIQNNPLAVYGINDRGDRTRFFLESPYVITTDEPGLYADQGDDPVQGYLTSSGTRRPCKLRIFHYGKPVIEKSELHIIQYRMTSSGADMVISLFRKGSYSDQDIITFPTDETSSVIYQFFPAKPVFDLNARGIYPIMLLKNGFFVNVRILPQYDFSQWTDPHHPQFQGPVTFEVLNKEIFSAYHLLYPIMSFSAHTMDNPAMARYLWERVKIEKWGSAGYMPVGRDLSQSQRLLIQSWVANMLEREKTDQHILEDQYHEISRSDAYLVPIKFKK